MAFYQTDIAAALKELEKLSNEDLKELCNATSDAKIDEFVNNLDKVKSLETEREMLIASVKSLAEFNLARQPTFETNRSQLVAAVDEANQLKAEIEQKGAKLVEISQRTSLESTLAVMLAATTEAEEESENVAQSFLSGTIPYDTFVNDYIEKRKLAHLRRIKADKMRKHDS